MARPGLTGHRKFRRLARALESAIVARGVLELLWEHCYESGEDYVGMSDDIEALVGWTGERGMLTRALADAGIPEGHGFIEPVASDSDGAPGVADGAAGQRFRVHDLWHHAPDYVRKRRERELLRLQKIAPDVGRTAPNGSQQPPLLDCRDGDVRTPSPSPSPSPVAKNGSSEPPRDSRQSATFLEFPVTGKDGPYVLTEAKVAEWQALFDTVNVRQECKSARAWIDANLNRRKTFGGMPAFLVRWFTKAANSRGGAAPVSQPMLDSPQATAKMRQLLAPAPGRKPS
jgi:hypothetical protein